MCIPTLNSLKQQQNGLVLRDLPQEMKGDREVCMAAVAQDTGECRATSTFEVCLINLICDR